MNELVDSELFGLPNWQSWVLFGACFYAVRINALLVLGYSTVTLEDLLPDMKMTEETRAITSSTPRLISQRYRSMGADWVSNGCIAVNEAVGDIFLA
ncbi:hypothetical protein P3T76_009036 [Phytophthora citrophthora]|uniref:Uncharacterized protein n=1 Tax=Phytophthora citrophthora TaxID=4793 RepID=A0AAD9LJV2_9STRA|nr:hypothetical protein P3T76_009036 [Phytophthora citrophthora]